MVTKYILIDSENIKLEARVTVPITSESSNGIPAIIIANPYGPLGGNINNNVVVNLHKSFTEKGFLTVSFNFRGSGKSSGRTSWTGIPEQNDYQSVINYFLNRNNNKTNDDDYTYPTISHLFICGYSYGSMIAAAMKETSIPTYYIIISYPLSVLWALSTIKMNYFKSQINQLMKDNQYHTLIIFGDHDQFTSEKSYQNWLNTITPAISTDDHHKLQYKKIEGVDHFWFDHEQLLFNYIITWIDTLSIL
ncbi:unnamed protein product [Cunninghamella blakesleeana]